MTLEEKQKRLRYLQLKAKAARAQPPAVQKSLPTQTESAQNIINDAIRSRLLGPASSLPVDAVAGLATDQGTRDAAVNNLPTIGAIGAGLAGTALPTPVRAGAAGIGAGGGEALRQLIERARGNASPETSSDAATQIAKQASLAAASEAAIPSVLNVAGKVARPITKVASKIGSSLSGTKPVNLMRAYARGLKETYLPAGQEFTSRAAAGAKQGAIEDDLLQKFFNAEERGALKLQDGSQANQFIKDAMVAKEMSKELKDTGRYLTPKQALGTLQAIDSKFPTPLSKKQGLSAELSKIASDARAIVASEFPEYSKALKTTEKAITRSQLSKPLRVTRSNPDEFSNVFGAGFPYTTPTALVSPLVMGIGAGTAGSIANAATSPLGSRVIAQGAGNPLLEALAQRLAPKKKEKK